MPRICRRLKTGDRRRIWTHRPLSVNRNITPADFSVCFNLFGSQSTSCWDFISFTYRARLLTQNEIHQEYKSGELINGMELYVEISIPLRH